MDLAPSAVAARDQQLNAPKGAIVVATLLVVASLYFFRSEITSDGAVDSWSTALQSNGLLASLKIAAICAGVVTAIRLWHFSRWALWGYVVWCVLFLAISFVTDQSVEPVAWKLAVGVGLRAVLPAIALAYLLVVLKK